MIRARAAVLAAVSLLAVLAWAPARVHAQPAEPEPAQPAVPDSVQPTASDAVQPAPPDSAPSAASDSAEVARADSTSRAPKKPQMSPEERDRWEFGVAMPEGFFDLLGTIAYRRVLRVRYPFQQSMKIELTGGHYSYLTEGSVSLYYLFRPIRSFKESWRIRPLVEVGPGLHVVVEGANIEGFDEYSYHTHGYLKLHGYLGVEFLATQKFGFLVCGRITVPDHYPLDYAQAAIFFR